MTVDRSTATATVAEEAFPAGSAASARRVLAASCLIGGTARSSVGRGDAPMVAGRLVIAVWMLLFGAIGYALLRTAEESRSGRDMVP